MNNTVNAHDLIREHLNRIPVGATHGLWNVGSVRRESETTWTLGERDNYGPVDIKRGEQRVEGLAVAAQAVLDRFPADVQSLVWSEQSRLRWRAESAARDIEAAKAERAHLTRMWADMFRAMRDAGCTCRFVAESKTVQDSYGDRVGYAVYADSQEAADRVAKWICRWSEKAYKGRYGGNTYDAQRDYSVRDIKPVEGAPFAVFASLRYYSIGD